MNNKKVAPQIAEQVDFFVGDWKSQHVLFHSPDWTSAQKSKLHHWCKYTCFIVMVYMFYCLYASHKQRTSWNALLLTPSPLNIIWSSFFFLYIYNIQFTQKNKITITRYLKRVWLGIIKKILIKRKDDKKWLAIQ